MNRIMILGAISTGLLLGCGSKSPMEGTSTGVKKLPLSEISQMLATNEMSPKCKFTDFSETAGVQGKKLTFKFKYDNQPEKLFSLNEIPDTTSSWNVGRGALRAAYWRLSYKATGEQVQTNFSSVDMAVDESAKKFETLELTPAGEATSTDCSAK
jgi:hypothetical protein